MQFIFYTMKIITVLLFLFSTVLTAQDLNLEFAKSYGSDIFDIGYDIHNDGAGNTYVCGVFNNTITFNTIAGDVTYTSNGLTDIFISKYNSVGNIVWVKRVGGTNNDNAYAIKTDAFGNILIGGRFIGTVDFDPGAGVVEHFSGVNSPFLLKLNADGNFIWVTIQSSASGRVESLVVDASNNIFITGEFRGSFGYNPGNGTFVTITSSNSGQSENAYLGKINGATGATIYYKAFLSTTNPGGGKAESVITDSSGNVYITGSLFGTVDFNPNSGETLLTSNGDSDIFVAKLSNAGNLIWAKSTGGTLYDIAKNMAIDANGNLLVSGGFRGTTDLDPSAAIFPLTSAGNIDAFVLQLDNNGNFMWANGFGANGTDVGESVAVDADNNVYTTGTFAGTVSFNTSQGVFQLTGPGNIDIFIYKQDAFGNFIAAHAIGGGSSDVPEAIMINAASEIFLTGSFSTTADFDPSATTTNLISNGSRDIFVAKYNGVVLSTPAFISEDNQTMLYPNPTSNVVQIQSAQIIKSAALFDLQGKLLFSKKNINNTTTQFDLKNNLQDGVYIIEIEFMDDSKTYKRLIKQ